MDKLVHLEAKLFPGDTQKECVLHVILPQKALDEQNATYAQIKGSNDALPFVMAFYAG